MARINGSVSQNTSYFGCYLEVTEGTPNIETNKSPVTVKVHITRSNWGWQTSNSYSGTIKIDGTSYSFKYSPNWAYASSGDVVIATATKDVPHNDDGSKTCSVSATWSTSGTYSCGTASASGSMILTKIARASTPTVTGTLELGETITINTNRAVSSFTHDLTYTMGSLTGIIDSSVGANTTWEIPKDLANAIPNSESGTLKITCVTYNGSSNIGSKTINVTISVPDTDEYKPSITDLTLSEAVGGIYEQFGTYIQNQSKLSYEITAEGVYSSTIISYKAVVNGATYTTQKGTTDVLLLSGSNSIVVEVTDSRGRTATLTDTFEVLAYNGISITQFTANRCDEDGTLNIEGEYVNIAISAKIPSLNGDNTYSYSFQYKDSDDTEYTQYAVTLTEQLIDTDIVLTGDFIMPADGNNAFDYIFYISDTFFKNVNRTADIETAFQLFNWNENGRGFALGKVSEKDAFEVNMPTYIEDVFDAVGLGKNIIDLIYPIGRGFIDFTDTDYSGYLGCTWERELIGMTPVGLNADDEDFNEIGKTGGEKEHTLTVDELPPTTLETGFGSAQTKDGALQTNTTSGWSRAVGMWASGGTTVYTKGGNQPHNNMQPYQVVAYWKRIA